MDEETLIQKHMGLVITIAKKFRPNSDYEHAEYIQEGSIALLRAIRKFDPTRNVQLSTFAWKYIHKAILKYILKQNKNKQVAQLSTDLPNKNTVSTIQEILHKNLTDKERTIIEMRLNNYTFEEIGKKIGCTRGWSNRLFNRAAQKIRDEHAR